MARAPQSRVPATGRDTVRHLALDHDRGVSESRRRRWLRRSSVIRMGDATL